MEAFDLNGKNPISLAAAEGKTKGFEEESKDRGIQKKRGDLCLIS